MQDNNLKNKTFTSLIWRFSERLGAQGVAFIVSIVLARLLAPEVYGTIALVTVFTSILNVFVDSGFGNALIQKKNADDLDFSTVFYFNLFICTLLYLGVFFLAGPIAIFYKNYELVPVIRVLSVTILISGVKNIQQAYVSKTLQFKRFFFATLGGTLGAAIIGITMACYGLGVWALVAQQIFNSAVDTIILWITVPWRPKRMFSFKRLKALFSVGWKLLASNLINTIYNDIRQLIIGKMYTKSDLAFYNRGQQIPNLVVTNINSSIDSVLLPVMSQKQDDSENLKAVTRRAIKTSSFIMWPMLIGIAVIAEPLVKVLLTDKWLGAVPYLQIFCIIYAFQPIQTANLNAIIALGRTDLYLKMEIIKKTIGLIILIISIKFGVLMIAIGLAVYSIIAQIINSAPNRKLLNYKYSEQLSDILPYIGLSLFMAVAVFLIGMINFNLIVKLIIQVILGAIIYISGAKLFKFDTFSYLISIVSELFNKSKGKVENASQE